SSRPQSRQNQYPLLFGRPDLPTPAGSSTKVCRRWRRQTHFLHYRPGIIIARRDFYATQRHAGCRNLVVLGASNSIAD
ncbi:MAG: hypothetical protein V2J55_22870, partial [Candidatus Competibacteraceae bacterium]|nr:hypothetical protein [Candidatus Competibacteraceae bacterium]